MNPNELIQKMAGMVEKVPEQVPVIALQQFSHEDLQNRARRFLDMAKDACQKSFERSDWVVQGDRTFIRLQEGGRAVIYHASGAIEMKTGLPPMESLFEKLEEREILIRMVESAAEKLELKTWAGPNESFRFENLFQIKAAGGDQKGQLSKPVLVRAVGTYRHSVADLPVLGPASVVIKIAGGGQVAALSLLARLSTDQVIEKVDILRPEQAARQVLGKMSVLMTGGKLQFSDVAQPQWFTFGYFDLGKRKAQRLLAPVYVAALHTEGDEPMNYLAVVSASEKQFLPLDGCISQAPVMNLRTAK